MWAGGTSFQGSQSDSGTMTIGSGAAGFRCVMTTGAGPGWWSAWAAGRANDAPHRLQKSEVPDGSGVPQEGQTGVRATGAGASPKVVPQRVQKRDWLSIAGLPQVLQTTGAGGIRVPHRLQNCAISSETTAPHPGQTGKAGFFSSGTGAPHRLQKSALSSSPAWPHFPQIFDMLHYS
jgi:hypothetical protein